MVVMRWSSSAFAAAADTVWSGMGGSFAVWFIEEG